MDEITLRIGSKRFTLDEDGKLYVLKPDAEIILRLDKAEADSLRAFLNTAEGWLKLKREEADRADEG